MATKPEFKLIAQSHRWPLTAVAFAALLGFSGPPAFALSLGRISVLSALGEPLKAEIDILSINPEEASSLNTRIAAPDAFKAAGLDYNAAMPGIQTKMSRRADGKPFIQLVSRQAINEPFVDLILEANWASGRIVRDYTLLFDPPNLRAPAVTPAAVAQAGATLPPQGAGAKSVNTVSPAPVAAPVAVPAPRPAPSPAAVKVARPTAATPAAAPQAVAARRTVVTIKAGDTASRIAAANMPANVSLEQMLVALLRANPRAFMGDNVNRLKAGAVVTLPTAAQAQQTPESEASKIIIAQSRDFNSFRQTLATNAPSTSVTPAERSVVGQVQAKVEDKKPTTTAPDKLTLSKGLVQGKSSEDQIAQTSNIKQDAQRVDEISKNISDLGKLAAATGASAAASAAGITVAPKAPVPAPKAAPNAAPETGFADALLQNPMLPAGAVGLIALLAGLGFYKLRQRKQVQFDSILNESRLQSESFFGASGGRNVDTRGNEATGSSMMYSPSQLDAVDDVDPVAEAAVYMAYGRDQQAEDILKEALRESPDRVTVHRKLLDIYAKRQDTKAFETIATLAGQLTGGKGSDWDAICELGLSLDPQNTLYKTGPLAPNPPQAMTGAVDIPAKNPPVSSALSQVEPPAESVATAPMDLDLDLDLDLDFPLDETTPVEATEATPEIQKPSDDKHDSVTAPIPHVAEPSLDHADGSLNFSMSLPDPVETPKASEAKAPPPPPPAPAATEGMLEFDLDSLSLDLDLNPATASAEMPDAESATLESKLALAEEFKAVGDSDGARALIEEVIVEATGDLKVKAQTALDKL